MVSPGVRGRGRGGAPFRGGSMRRNGPNFPRGGMPSLRLPGRGGGMPQHSRMLVGPPHRGVPPRMRPPPPPLQHNGPPMRPFPPGIGRPPLIRPPPPPPPPMMMHSPQRGGFRGKPPQPRFFHRDRIMKRNNRPSLRNIDLTKPWITELIRGEFNKKDELLAVAKSTQSQSDWANYREQREKCSRVYHETEAQNLNRINNGDNGASVPMQPLMEPEVSFGDYYVHEEDEIEDEELLLNCDTCERDFSDKESFLIHMSEHRVCNLDGCLFTAHEKIIEKHIRMQHLTGIYDRIKNLDTKEDVKKWIQERRKNYPSQENVEKRYKEQEHLLKKGIRLEKHPNKFGRNKFSVALDKPNSSKNGVAVQNNTRRQHKRKTGKVKKNGNSLIDEKSDWNGKLFPFKGTKELFNITDALIDDDFPISDNETTQNNSYDTKINKSLGSLMEAYASDSDHEPPAELKFIKQRNNVEEIVTPSSSADTNKIIIDQKQKVKNKIIKKVHEIRPSDNNFPYNNFKKRKLTLLEKLLEKDIRHERNLILQCVRYTVENNFFK